MSGDIGFYTILPDQMQVVNPLLILAFIPLFDTVIYPLLNKCKALRTPLQRLTVGGLLAAVAFILSALVELQLEVITKKSHIISKISTKIHISRERIQFYQKKIKLN